ncbi:MAG: proton-conducting transporter membrane subunit [Myxococcota bacterium]
MSLVVLAASLLLVGAGLALLPMQNASRAWLSIGAQALATALVLETAIPVLFGAPSLSGKLAWAYPVGTIDLSLDPLGAFFLVWSLPMTLLGSIYALGYLRADFDSPRNVGLHYALLNLTSFSFIIVYATEHALILLLGWEIAALAAWLLVIWDHKSQRIRFAGFNYLVSTHIGLLFLVAALMVLYTHAKSWDLPAFHGWLSAAHGGERNVVFLLLVVSFGLKSAFFPFHSWLPRAHAAAPAHVSALMSGVIHKAGLYALVRFLLLFGTPDPWMGWFLIAFSITSAVIGAIYTATQRDLKRLLGYSSTENVGIAGVGIGLGCLGLSYHAPALVAAGFAGGLLHVLNHAFFKCQLFYAAGAVYRSAHSVDLEKLGGLLRSMPWTGAFFLLGGVAISGLPPLNGFVSEVLIYSGLLASEAPRGQGFLVLVAALLAFVGAVSLLSMARAFGIAFLGHKRAAQGHAVFEAPIEMRAPMLVHAIFVVGLGLLPFAGLALVREPARLFLNLVGADNSALAAPAALLQTLSLVSVGLTALIGLFILLRARALPRPGPEQSTWGCGYPGTHPRVQYTGGSFSDEFRRLFRRAVVVQEKQELPRGLFPTSGRVETNTRDAVEQRLYETLGRGEDTVRLLSRFLGVEQPRIAFSAGLIAVLIIGLILVATGGGS